MIRVFGLIFLFILFCGTASAHFDFNANCTRAYQEIVALRLGNARELIDSEKKKNPSNAVTLLLDNYVDYFSIITSESKAEFERLKNNKSVRLDRLEKEDRTSPWFLYSQAEINLQWALVHGLFQEYFNSSMEINRAFKQLKENVKKHPSFLPNQMGYGMVNAVLGSLPEGLKKLVAIIGIKGNTAEGVKQLENLVKTLPGSAWPQFYDEAVFCLAYVKTDILRDKSSFPLLASYARQMAFDSQLKVFVLAYSATRTGNTDEALAALKSKKESKAYTPFPKLDYLKGIARVHKLDQGAASDLQAFLDDYHGVNGSKDAWLNLAWLELLKGNTAGYKEKISKVKSTGYELFDKDKQALVEAGDPAPDTNLLRSRLLFDGGYYAEALSAIDGQSAANFKLLRDRIEYSYRLGRIYDELEKDEAALKFYQSAITLGKKERYYFASNAAIRMGAIYENRKEPAKAKSCYKQALEMQDHDYEKSIESQAKEGLKRTGG